MPIKLTEKDFNTAIQEILVSRPPSVQGFEVRLSFFPTSFNISGNEDYLVIRLADKNGMLSDVTLSPWLTIELVSQLEKAMVRSDWTNLDGNPSLKSASRSPRTSLRRKAITR